MRRTGISSIGTNGSGPLTGWTVDRRCGTANDAPHRWGLASRRPERRLPGGVCHGRNRQRLPARTGGREGPEWASSAEEYAAALNDAYRVGITDAMRFYAPDAHVDKRFINYEGVGRAGFAQALRDNSQNPPTWTGGRNTTDRIDLVPTEPLYLSRDRFLEPLRRIDPTIVPSIDAAFVYTVGAAGIADEMILGSAASGMWTCPGGHAGRCPGLGGPYLDGWTSGDSGGVRGLYTADATLTDSLAGREITGASAIAVEAGATSALSLRGPHCTKFRTTPGQPPSPLGATAPAS